MIVDDGEWWLMELFQENWWFIYWWMVSGQIKSPVIILRELNYDLMFIKKDSLSNLMTYYCWLFWFWDLVIYGIRMGSGWDDMRCIDILWKCMKSCCRMLWISLDNNGQNWVIQLRAWYLVSLSAPSNLSEEVSLKACEQDTSSHSGWFRFAGLQLST